MSTGNDRRLLFLIIGFALGFITYSILSGVFFPPPLVMPIFSPENGSQVIDFIKSANESIDVEVYAFSSEDALAELINAKDRGVQVRVIIEKDIEALTNAKTFNKLKAAGIDVRWASQKYALTHAKFIIVDGKLVIVGSHNLSKNALEKNREASVIISGDAVKAFIEVFEKDWNLAQISS